MLVLEEKALEPAGVKERGRKSDRGRLDRERVGKEAKPGILHRTDDVQHTDSHKSVSMGWSAQSPLQETEIKAELSSQTCSMQIGAGLRRCVLPC